MLALALAACLSLLPTGCGKPAPSSTPPAGTSPKLRVVATVGMVADLVRHVAGEHAEVTVLLGPGTDPHLYKPTPGDLRTLEGAQIVFASGLALEGKMEQTLTSLAKRLPMVAVTDAIPRDKLRAFADHPGAYDPHVWFDVQLWAACITPVEEALAKLDPQHAREYRANAVAYLATLTELDIRVREQIATIPKEKRVLVTAHDAFGYFGRTYDIEVLGVQGMSTESEASLKDINDLVHTLVTRGVPAVFVESSVPKKNIEALLQGAAARGHVIRVGGELYSDAMGPANTPEGTYIGMIEHNVRTIVEALR
jgi:manganese/zinc/iron transport system substrate-binding protein